MKREIRFRFWNEKLDAMEDSYYDYLDGMDLEMVFDQESNGNRIPMQFIGLKDRNGIDIYEGDILEDSYLDITVTIEFKGGCFVGMHGVNEVNNRNWFSFKIIGNIHENPELLK